MKIYFESLNKKNMIKIFWALITILTFFRFMIYCRSTVTIFSNEYFDDQMLHDMARSLARLDWLGQYDCRTLSKGISYEFFIAVMYLIDVPYTAALGLLNILGAFVFIYAFRPIIKQAWVMGIGFLFLTWNPVTFDWYISRRVYRNALVPGLVLLTFGFMIGAYLRRREKNKYRIIWFLGEGVFLTLLYLLREDSIWILPSVIVVIAIELGTLIFNKVKKAISKKELIVNTIYVFIPVMMLIIATQMICALNYHYYGLWITNDRMDSSFSLVVDDLYKIKDNQDENQSVVWISKDAIQQAMSASETLERDRDQIELFFKAWSTENDEVKGDLSVWALRQALWQGENFSSARELENYCKQVHKELTEAFNNGQLIEDDKLHLISGMEGTSIKEIGERLVNTVSTLNKLSKYDYLSADSIPSSGDTNRTFDTAELLGSHVNLSGYTTITYTSNFNGQVEYRSNKMIIMYRFISVISKIVAFVTFIIFIVFSVKNLKHKKWTNHFDIFIIMIGIFLSLYVLEFGQLMAMRFQTDESMIITCTHLYSAGVYEMIDMLYVLGYMFAIIFIFKKVSSLVASKKN